MFTVLFNFPFLFLNKGPGVLASRTCMDKVMTSQALSNVWKPIDILFKPIWKP